MAEKTPALAYLRTSSASNVGGDSDVRQRLAIRAFAQRSGMEVVGEHYDAAVSGADPLDQRAGFTALLAEAQARGVHVVLVETASRFARSLMVQELGLQMLRQMGIKLIAVDSPDAFTAEGDPMVAAVRQMMGVMAELDRAMTVAKLRAARDRASAAAGCRVEGRKGYAETHPALVRETKRLARKNPVTGKRRSLRQIATELVGLGYTTATGKPLDAKQVARLVQAEVVRKGEVRGAKGGKH
jgi:DNA invertase Pin-like site-specific DNA recombinase